MAPTDRLLCVTNGGQRMVSGTPGGVVSGSVELASADSWSLMVDGVVQARWVGRDVEVVKVALDGSVAWRDVVRQDAGVGSAQDASGGIGPSSDGCVSWDGQVDPATGEGWWTAR